MFASENRTLLTEILREEWGFEGAVISDWTAVHTRAEAVKAGCDLTMPAAIDTDGDLVGVLRPIETGQSMIWKRDTGLPGKLLRNPWFF